MVHLTKQLDRQAPAPTRADPTGDPLDSKGGALSADTEFAILHATHRYLEPSARRPWT